MDIVHEVFRSTQRGKCKATARTVSHYGLPVLWPGDTHVPLDRWNLRSTTETSFAKMGLESFRELPSETITVDVHCVTRCRNSALLGGRFSRHVYLQTFKPTLLTPWRIPMATTHKLPLDDLKDKKAWIAFRFDGKDLEPNTRPAASRPHLYLWKSAKWVRGITLMLKTSLVSGRLGYHIYGDPWREQRYSGDR